MSRSKMFTVLPIALAVVACGGSADSYTADIESEYMVACVEEATLSLDANLDLDADNLNSLAFDYCACTWGEIVDEIAVEDFLAEDAAISTGSDISEEFNNIVNDCAEEVFSAL
jgi:hypothetical protein